MKAERGRHFRQIRSGGIGYRAHKTLATVHEGAVLGMTSRGLFLQSTGRWLVFISYEPYLSPLTITIQTPAAGLPSVETGDTVLVRKQRLSFPRARIDLLLPEDVWQPDDPPATLDPFPERVKRLKEMTLGVAAAGQERELGLLLRPLLSLPVESSLPAEQQSALDAASLLQRSIRVGDREGAIAAAGRLMGRGRGLTASGDDFLIGFLLFASRHPTAVRPEVSLHAFSQNLIENAYGETTRISANLIEAAADGHSDERLLAAADCIATGTPSPHECLSSLLSWGASSGVDALAGMACAATL